MNEYSVTWNILKAMKLPRSKFSSVICVYLKVTKYIQVLCTNAPWVNPDNMKILKARCNFRFSRMLLIIKLHFPAVYFMWELKYACDSLIYVTIHCRTCKWRL